MNIKEQNYLVKIAASNISVSCQVSKASQLLQCNGIEWRLVSINFMGGEDKDSGIIQDTSTGKKSFHAKPSVYQTQF